MLKCADLEEQYLMLHAKVVILQACFYNHLHIKFGNAKCDKIPAARRVYWHAERQYEMANVAREACYELLNLGYINLYDEDENLTCEYSAIYQANITPDGIKALQDLFILGNSNDKVL